MVHDVQDGQQALPLPLPHLTLQFPKACEQLTVVLDDAVSWGIGVNGQDHFDDLELEAGL